MPQLQANWPDRQSNNVQLKSSLIDLEPRTIGQQGGTLYEGDRERLSEKTLSISYVEKRCDSPNPESLARAIVLWKEGLVWRQIASEINVPERTLRRYLRSMGYKRGYDFVRSKIKGLKRSPETCKRISVAKKQKELFREKNPNWRGGAKLIWNTSEWKIWRKSIFERDNYICKGCGIKNGGGKTIRFNAHHILPRRDFPHLTFCLSNGITLCEDCHNKTKKKEYLSVNIWKQRV